MPLDAAPDPQVILIVFDGLRRDLATAAFTPTLHAFLADNADFPGARAVFPTMTRVNAAAIGSGCVPTVSGVVANQFFDPTVFPDALVHTGKVAHVDAAMAAYGDRFVEPDGLGDVLAAHGRRLAVVTSASGGTTRMLNPRVVRHGGARPASANAVPVSLCVRDWPSSRPRDVVARVTARFGPPPPLDLPAAALTRRVADIALDWVLPEVDPDVLILWFGDPDYTQHHTGLGSALSVEAMRAVDRQLARLLDWAGDAARRRPVQILVASDHGHLNAAGHVAAARALHDAGFDLDPAGGGDLKGAPLQIGSVCSAGADGAARLRDLVHWLHEQPWCGAIFTKDGLPGTFSRDLVLNDHARSADLAYTLRSDDTTGPHGVAGTTRFVGTELKDGGSTHGGLHRFELGTVLGAGGSAFRARFASPLPCGVVDITPTILSLFGIAVPPHMSGRPLAEAFAGAAADLPAAEEEAFTVRHAAGTDTLRRRRIGRHVYLDGCARTGA